MVWRAFRTCLAALLLCVGGAGGQERAALEVAPPVSADVLRVRVRDRDGTPLSGCEVRWSDGDADARVARGDDAGLARFEPAPPYGRGVLAARASGYAEARTPLGRSLDVVLVLAPAARLTGTVRTREGTPLAGARVVLTTPQREAGAPLVARADAAGRYVVAGVPTDEELELWCEGQDGAWTCERFRLAADARVVEKDLVPREGLPVRLLARDASSGEPLAGARLRVEGAPFPSGISAASGRVVARVAPVAPGAWVALVLERDGFRPAPWLVDARTVGSQAELALVPAALPIADQERVTRATTASGTLVGRVLLNGVGQEATVALRWPDASGSWPIGGLLSAATAPDGTFALRGVPAGPVTVGLERVGTLPLGRARCVQERATIEPGAPARVELALNERLVTVRGRVVDARGRPAGGARVTAAPWRYGAVRARTDATGAFALEVPANELPVALSAEDDAGASARASASGAPVSLALVTTPALVLRLVDAENALPIAGARLFVRPAGTVEWRELHAPARDEAGWGACQLAAGRWDVLARADAAGYAPVERADVRVEAGARVRTELAARRGLAASFRLARGSLSPAAAGGVYLVEPAWFHRVDGRTTAPLWCDGGDPLPGFPLDERKLCLDVAEELRVRGLAPGRYRLKAIAPAVVCSPAEIEIGPQAAGPIEIELRAR